MSKQPVEIIGWESDVVIFDLVPLVQGQMRVAKLKSAYKSLIAPSLFKSKTNL